MTQTNFATIRQVQRHYKDVVKELEKTGRPTIVLSNNRPQFAIITMLMLEAFPTPTDIDKAIPGIEQR